MKKILSLVIIGIMVFSLTACEKRTEDNFTGQEPANRLEISEKENNPASAERADVFQIEAVSAYPETYGGLLDASRQEMSDNARPEIAGTVDNMEDYEIVFVGYPNWLAYHNCINLV